jgi:proline iminopeptidase
LHEEPFEVPVAGGVLSGHRGGDGRPALLLHGGPAVPDYTDGLAEELDGLFSTFRYTQRGVPPSTVGPPYSIESHMADAMAVLDFFDVERAWAIGHSWGGHLGLHLVVTYPERIAGFIGVDPLGAVATFEESDAGLRRGLSEEQIARVDDVEALRRRGEATEDDLLERFRIIWPQYFAEPESAPPPPIGRGGTQCSTDTNASIAQHFERGTLSKKLPDAWLPAMFVHGLRDPLPMRASTETAALIAGAKVETIDCGHFPWLERPGEIRAAVQRFLAGLPGQG